MARGRPPKPVEQRRLEGGSEVSHRPVPEPLLVAGRPDLEKFRVPPPYLPNDAKEFWGETIQRLTEVGIIDLVDGVSLELMAIQYARSRQAGRVVAVEGHFAPGAAGQIKEHPALKIERDAMAMFLRYASEFALTPVARTRLGMAELGRRAMASEMEKELDGPKADFDADAEEVNDDDVGLPGA